MAEIPQTPEPTNANALKFFAAGCNILIAMANAERKPWENAFLLNQIASLQALMSHLSHQASWEKQPNPGTPATPQPRQA